MYFIFLLCALYGIYNGLTRTDNITYNKDSGDFFSMLFLKNE